MAVWDNAKKKMSDHIKEIEKSIRTYDYSTDASAEATDGKICSFIIEELRTSKDILFGIIQAAYELHEESLNKHFENLRHDLDVFSDEIKIRNFEWSRDISEKWMNKLIKHDYSLVTEMKMLNQELDELHKIFLRAIKLYPEKTDPNDLEKIKNLVKLLEKAANEIVLIFKEREVICNLKPAALEKTFKQMQDYYERLV